MCHSEMLNVSHHGLLDTAPCLSCHIVDSWIVILLATGVVLLLAAGTITLLVSQDNESTFISALPKIMFETLVIVML